MGYALDLFVDKNIDDEFICTICQDVLEDVTMIVSCEHVFCKSCINQWMKSSRTCPIDRQIMRKFQSPQRSYMNLLGRLQLHCPHMNLGCTTIVNLCDVKEHEERCELSPENNKEFLCSSGCGVIMKKFQLKNHICTGNPLKRSESGGSEDKLEEKKPRILEPMFAENRIIWTGMLNWDQKELIGSSMHKVQRQIVCSALSKVINNETEIKGHDWPSRLTMQLIPKSLVGMCAEYKDVNLIQFQLQNCELSQSLIRSLSNGFAGCLHFIGTNCPIKLCILLYSRQREGFIGFIPKDQIGFVTKIRAVIMNEQEAKRRATSPTTAALLTPLISLAPPMYGRSTLVHQEQSTSTTLWHLDHNRTLVPVIPISDQQQATSSASASARLDPQRSETEQINIIVRQIEQLERSLASARRQHVTGTAAPPSTD